MKNQIPSTPEPSNMLGELQNELISIATVFRQFVCEECNWSIPTYYRKMRTADKPAAGGKIIPALSNAEKEKIVQIYEVMIMQLRRYSTKYRKGGSNNDLDIRI
jgi:hypothetical protein